MTTIIEQIETILTKIKRQKKTQYGYSAASLKDSKQLAALLALIGAETDEHGDIPSSSDPLRYMVVVHTSTGCIAQDRYRVGVKEIELFLTKQKEAVDDYT